MSLDELRAVLERYPAIVRPCAAPESLGNAGGASGARLWRFAAACGTLVARAWPADGPDARSLERIHAWLRRAAHLGYVPVPLGGLDGRTIQVSGGRLWEVAPWLPGEAAKSGPTSGTQRDAAFRALAAFHQCLADERVSTTSPGLRARVVETEELLRGGFARLCQAVDQAPSDRRAELARRWLDLAERMAPRVLEPLRRAAGMVVSLQPCLRDARPEHILFEGERVSGLIDFGAMDFDVVAADLARLLGGWGGLDRPARLRALDAYASVRPLSSDEASLIDVFESSTALLGAGHWVRWHFVERRTFGDPGAVELGIANGLARLIGRLA